MSKRGRTCAAMTLALVILSTGAKAQNAPKTIFGAGAASCGEFAEIYQRDPDGAQLYYFSWVQGYLSGVYTFAVASARTPGKLERLLPSSVDHEEWFRHMRRFCDARPLANIYEAAFDLMQKLRRK